MMAWQLVLRYTSESWAESLNISTGARDRRTALVELYMLNDCTEHINVWKLLLMKDLPE